jgi:hypothetical protein
VGIGLILLLTFAISRLRRAVNVIWLIIVAVVLCIIALVWFGFTMRDQSKPGIIGETPTPAEYEMDDYN